jgi:hypothetical protein
MSDGPGTTGVARAPRPERLLTLPLGLFLAGVLALLGSALLQTLSRPDPASAVRLLADGDLDGAERRRVLRQLLAVGVHSQATADRWAAALAAVALDDRAGLAAATSALGGGAVPNPLPDAPARELLHLGDPYLRNLLAAWVAEASGQPQVALVHWQQLAAQCRFAPRPLAAELAAAGIARSRRGG